MGLKITQLKPQHINAVMSLMEHNNHDFVGMDTQENAMFTINDNLSIGSFIDKKLVGFILCYAPRELDVFDYQKEKVLINDLIVVDSHYSGIGIATNLLNHLEQICKQSNLTTIIATVSPFNVPSLKAHLRSGFFVESCLCKKEISTDTEHGYGMHAFNAFKITDSAKDIKDYRYLMVKEITHE